MELYVSDHPDDGLTDPANGDLRAAGHGGGGRPERGALRPRRQPRRAECKTAGQRRCTADGRARTPISPTIPAKCIVCYRCVRACEEVQGTFALTVEGRGFESRIVAGMAEDFLASECVSCGACVQACPTGSLVEKARHRDRRARAFEDHHLRLLRRRLRLQGRDARRGSGAHGAVEGRQGQPRPLLRQGPLRLRLCHPPGAHPEADGAREDHRSVARDHLGGGDRPRRLRVPPHPGRARQRRGRRHHLVALHQRGDLPRAEADPRRASA